MGRSGNKADDRSHVREKDWQATVRGAAQLNGWLVFATWNSRNSPKGMPDLTMARSSDGRVIFAELKSVDGKLSPEQAHALNVLRQCPGVEVYVWRPSDDWDEIAKVLAR